MKRKLLKATGLVFLEAAGMAAFLVVAFWFATILFFFLTGGPAP